MQAVKGKKGKKKGKAKAAVRLAENALVQTSFDTTGPVLVSRGVSAASLCPQVEREPPVEVENGDPFGEFASQPRAYRLLHQQEAELRALRSQLQALQCRPPLRDAAVNTSHFLPPSSSSASSSSSALSEARFSVPSLHSDPPAASCERSGAHSDPLIGLPELSATSVTMALGESASMWQNLGQTPQMATLQVRGSSVGVSCTPSDASAVLFAVPV